jgi:hypothetical protein
MNGRWREVRENLGDLDCRRARTELADDTMRAMPDAIQHRNAVAHHESPRTHVPRHTFA